MGTSVVISPSSKVRIIVWDRALWMTQWGQIRFVTAKSLIPTTVGQISPGAEVIEYSTARFYPFNG